MKRFRSLPIAFLMLFLSAGKSNAQNAVDSLTHLLAFEKQDTSRVILLMQLSNLQYKLDSALMLAQQSYKLSQKIKFAKGEALSLKGMGAIYGITGNYPKGLEMLLQSLKISESMNDLKGLMICYIAIGANYSHQGDYQKSLDYFYKAKPLTEVLHNEKYQLISLLDLGDSFEKLNQLDSARSITQECLKLAIRYANAGISGIALNNLGNIYTKLGKDDLAKSYYRQSIPILAAENNDDAISEATLGMAYLFKKEGKADSAIYFSRQSLAAAKQGSFTKRLLDASNFLSVYFENTDAIDSAYFYQKISIAAKDSLFSQEKVKEMQILSFTEQIRQLEIKEAAETAATKRKNNIQMAFIGVFIPVFFGIILLFRKRKANPRTLAFMGLLALLMLFEFVTMLIDPYIEEWTHDIPVLTLVMLVAVASLLVPMHHKLEHLVKERLAHRKLPG